jgi:trigger factor
MNITFQEKENLLGEVKLELDPQDYFQPIQKKLKDVSKYAKMPGFRPGKVPTSLLQKMYGKSILFEEINKLINTHVSEYLKNNNIDLLFNYEIDTEKSSMHEMEQFNFKQPSALNFYLNVVIKPKLNISLPALLADNNLNTYKVSPTEEEIEEYITDLSYDYGTRENPETIDLNDYLYGSLTTSEDETFKKPMQLNLRKAPLQIAEKFLGKKAEDTVEFDTETIKTLQDNNAVYIVDDGFLSQENTPKTYTYTVKNISRIVAKELNEEFYAMVSEEKAKDKDTFHNFIRERLIKQYAFLAKENLYEEVMEKLIQKADISLPADLIREKLSNLPESNFNTLTPEKQEEMLKQQIKSLKARIISDDILASNNITITEEDLQRQSIIDIKYRFSYMTQTPIMEFLNLDDIDLENPENYQLLQIAGKVFEEEKEYRKLYTGVEKHYLQKIISEQAPLEHKEVSIKEFKKIQK